MYSYYYESSEHYPLLYEYSIPLTCVRYVYSRYKTVTSSYS